MPTARPAGMCSPIRPQQLALEYSYLSGSNGPMLDTRPGWDVDGMEWRILHDFGCGAIDWRGVFRNPG